MTSKPYIDLPTAEFTKRQLNNSNAILLDVRTPSEYKDGHLENALNIDIKSQHFMEEIEDLDPSKHYYIYCSIGLRSANACVFLASLGFSHIFNLKGGLKAIKKHSS